MNKRRTVVLSVGFLSLAIFAIIVTAMVYIKNNESAVTAEKNTAAYVATRTIPSGEKIKIADIELRSLPADYVGENPLSMADIVDRHAAVDIIKSDLIRAEKLSLAAPSRPAADQNRSMDENATEKTVAAMLHDVISVPLAVFKNPDTSLRAGDRIDILGISDKGEEKRLFSTRYIALHVAVAGFMKEGQRVKEMVSIGMDEKTKTPIKVLADEILLDMSPREISRFLSLYYRSQELNNERSHNPNNLYRGHIWMVRSNPVVSEREEAAKMKMMGMPEAPLPKLLPSQNLHPMPKLVSVPKGIVSYEQ